ncbi:MAG: hypothetical protein CO099_02565 [Bdellovibrio sp. CG_4_9_14_3_um_filter_39_7]|nr:MAG: hypothetical protein CO099_02565 [Bdellovibrio sp. CG_4_9_14_3_um_filter_39_7]
MKKISLLKISMFVLTFSALSCVPQDPCAKSGGTVTTGAATTGDKASCTDPNSGSDGGTVTPPPVNQDPTPPSPTPITGGDPWNQPWKRSDTSIVIDAYELNGIDWDKMATDKKMVGVIHRSSIGLTVDKQYKARRAIASERGYLWGAYHLGRRGDTIKQADLFLSLVGNDPDALMVLDLEDTASSSFMSIDEAVVFMDYVYEQTGRIPVVYANHSTTQKVNQLLKSNPLFPQAKLWYARFKSSVTDFPVGIWDNYFLWQFSSEINCTKTGSCLYNVPGTSSDMDVNVFNGSATDLRMMWNND